LAGEFKFVPVPISASLSWLSKVSSGYCLLSGTAAFQQCCACAGNSV